jgi:hypothetical protein
VRNHRNDILTSATTHHAVEQRAGKRRHQTLIAPTAPKRDVTSPRYRCFIN